MTNEAHIKNAKTNDIALDISLLCERAYLMGLEAARDGSAQEYHAMHPDFFYNNCKQWLSLERQSGPVTTTCKIN